MLCSVYTKFINSCLECCQPLSSLNTVILLSLVCLFCWGKPVYFPDSQAGLREVKLAENPLLNLNPLAFCFEDITFAKEKLLASMKLLFCKHFKWVIYGGGL